MSKYHVLLGKRVSVDKYDTDHLLRLMLKISKRCRKFALKHSKGDDRIFGDDGVWVARGFVKKYELFTYDIDPLVAAEKFMTMLDDHYKKYGGEV